MKVSSCAIFALSALASSASAFTSGQTKARRGLSAATLDRVEADVEAKVAPADVGSKDEPKEVKPAMKMEEQTLDDWGLDPKNRVQA
jgi:hypothetical protein